LREVYRNEGGILPVEYAMLKGWWEGHGRPAVAEEVLPHLGVVAEVEGAPVAAGWLYMDCSVGVSMLEWLVSDPAARPRDVYAGLREVVRFLERMAAEFGKPVMLTTSRRESLSGFLEKQGFVRTDEGMTHFVKVVSPDKK